MLRTAQETSHPSRVTIEYWAFGLEPMLAAALVLGRGRIRDKSIERKL